jgi:hypothetical protein
MTCISIFEARKQQIELLVFEGDKSAILSHFKITYPFDSY